MSVECNDGVASRAGLVRKRQSLKLWPAALLVTASCAHCQPPQPFVLPPDDRGPLPDGKVALLKESDDMVARGPAGPSAARSYRAAERCYYEYPCDAEGRWRMSRALYLSTVTSSISKKEAKRLSNRCLDIDVVDADPVEVHYYRALCLAAKAQAKKTEALSLIPKMVESGEAALKRDASFLHAGPHRLLGGIYLRAPAWPVSVGDLDEALMHLEKAAELGPDWAENHLLLAEAYLEDERPEEARKCYERAKSLLSAEQADGWRDIWAKDLGVIEGRLAP